MGLLDRLIGFFRGDDVPFLSRHNYRREMAHVLLWGLFTNLIGGSFSSIVVAKTFHGSALLVSVVWATPMLAHLMSFVWGVVIRGRRRVPTYTVLAIAALLSVASIAATPADAGVWAGWVFALQVAAARVFLSGIVTLRSSIWAANYPGSHRARIAGRLQFVNILLLLLTVGSVSWLFDRHPAAYRWVYPLIAVLAVLALLPLRRIRIRGERRELAEHRRRLAADGGGAGGWAGVRAGIAEAAAILRRDRAFARYCTAQYFLGSANFLVDPLLTILITQRLAFSYFQCSLMMDLIPTVLMLLSIQRWSHHFDRVGVLQFRVINSLFWVGSGVLVTVGALVLGATESILPGITLIAGSRVLYGIATGGGQIAWNLGHLQFAQSHNDELYMGIHQALTGVRALIMPIVGSAVYVLVGPWTFGIAIACSMAALHMFRQLAREHARPAASAEALVSTPDAAT